MSPRHFVKHLSAAASRLLLPPASSPSLSSLSFVHSAFEPGTCCAAPSRIRKRSFCPAVQGEPSNYKTLPETSTWFDKWRRTYLGLWNRFWGSGNSFPQGATHAIGVDIDPQAISSAQYNASLNNIGPEKLQLCLIPSEDRSHPGGTERGNYDVVKPGATVGLSGILLEQVTDIRSRYSCLLEELSIAEMDGWACISGKRKSESKF